MSDISIRRNHGMTMKRARVAAEKIASHLEDEFELAWEWQGNRLHFKRSGVSGHLEVSRHHVAIEARLGFLLAFLKPRIESEINKYCDEQFGKSSDTVV